MITPFKSSTGKRTGFTLIELLIVIAIILILIAIALPNFLEAQIRARVTKAKGELRSLRTAMESYYLDWKIYPEENESNIVASGEGHGLLWLTTPIKYITSIPEDPFATLTGDSMSSSIVTYESGGMERGIGGGGGPRPSCLITWAIWSKGPDYLQEVWAENPHFDTDRDVRNYAPTNGTNSIGSIYVWGGDPSFIGISAQSLAHYNANRAFFSPPVGLTVDGEIYIRRLPRF
jgi:type II secretion system protein G